MSTWPERPIAHSITATDDEIRKAVSEAEVPPLLPALATSPVTCRCSETT
jgi:hypothetical protein